MHRNYISWKQVTIPTILKITLTIVNYVVTANCNYFYVFTENCSDYSYKKVSKTTWQLFLPPTAHVLILKMISGKAREDK